jgi:tight adherence protein C
MQLNRDILVPALVFVAIMAIGGLLVMMKAGRRRELEDRLHADGRIPEPAQSSSSSGVQLLHKIGAATSTKKSAKLQQQLVMAGFHSKNAVEVYLGTKVLALAGGLVGGLALMLSSQKPMGQKLMIGMLIAGACSFLPNFFVSMRRRARTGEVRRTLPDATDLLEICVSAGMGLDTAWNNVTDEIRRVSDTLADEMTLTNLEIQLGAPRHAAMRHMARRTGAPELSSLVAVLVQSEKFGTSVSDALRSFAGTMREDRSQRAEESAEKMGLKMLFPMVLFIFPAAFIVLVGPAAIRISEVLLK